MILSFRSAVDQSRRLTGALVLLGQTLTAQAQSPLTNIAEIRATPRAVAAQSLPVKVRGVVTFAFRYPRRDFVVYNHGKGIYVNAGSAFDAGTLAKPPGAPDHWQRGDLVEVEGFTAPGGFAPVIVPQRITLLSTTAPPAAIAVTLPQLLTGAYDCQSVSLQGLVQRIGIRTNATNNPMTLVQLLVATEGGGHFVAESLNAAGFDPAKLVGAQVRVSGCGLSFFNRRGELLGMHLVMTDRDDLEVFSPPPPEPFSVPEINLNNLQTFTSEGLTPQRRRVQGVVTLSRPGEFFYLQSGDRAVRVTTIQPEPLAVGDEVEVVGFPEVSQYYGELREGVFRKLGTAPLPKPIELDWERATQRQPQGRELETFDFDGRLVRLQGRLVRVETIPGQPVRLYLVYENRTITATFDQDVPASAIDNIRLGSIVDVTGICVMSLAQAWPTLDYPVPIGFNLLLRSPADVTVVHAASWWTATRLFGALAGTVIVLALALIWVSLLHRTVNKQAARLVAEEQSKHDAAVEFKATLRERNRIAADLHDTMEQDLASAVYQLEAARMVRTNQSDEAFKLTDFAHELLDRTRDDLRRSVWSMRVGLLEGRSFTDALRELTSRTERTYGVACTCDVAAAGFRVPEFEANHLLLLAQEAVTNALKHGNPRSIALTGSITAQNISLTVTDDGRGFDPTQAPGPQQGHFGLLGMRERVRALSGTLDIQSSPERGARVVVNIPLKPALKPV